MISAISLVPLAYSQGTLSITLSTDKTQYVPGETMTISGIVFDPQNNPTDGASVSIQVGDPPMHIDLVFSGISGAYSDSFVVPENTSPGEYTVYATASKAGFTSAQQEKQITVAAQSNSTFSSFTSSSSSQFNPPSPCFIATATYGSEVSPEVALLRNFRDGQVLHTSAGRGFMLAFNAFYYSFSPQVASVIGSHPQVRTMMRATLYPLIGILYFSSKVFQTLSFNQEFAVSISGIFAALGIGALYAGPLVILAGSLTKRRKFRLANVKEQLLGCCVGSVFALILSEAIGSTALLTGAAVATVLSFLALGALITWTAYMRVIGRAR